MAPSPPTADDIFHYRYHHGTNLGSIFVLERWLSGSMYVSSAPGDSELDAVKASISAIGLDATRSKWQAHWSSALTPSDLDWLVSTAKANMIRLPIGYFTLGPAFCANTPFAGPRAEVYSTSAWAAVKDLVRRCHDRGVGVLMDLHAVPGGANDQIHSGTSSGRAELWGNVANLDLATRCLVFIAEEAARGELPGCVGIQPCNEAGWNAQGMYDWYDGVIRAVNAVNPAVPIYISDGWDFGRAVSYVHGKNDPGNSSNPIIIDTHKYYCYSASDTSQSAPAIIDRIPRELSELDGKDGDVFDRGAASALVGEYSCVLAESSWNQGGDRAALIKRFGNAQSKRWQARANGTAFWTLKMDWMDGGEWGFKAQSDTGAIVPPRHLMLSVQDVRNVADNADGRMQSLRDAALGAHTAYWDRTAPGERFEHERYGEGWTLGWGDARAFFRARADGVVSGGGDGGGNKIGALDVWVRKRMAESGQAKGRTGYGWEWEQGVRKGVEDWCGAVGI